MNIIIPLRDFSFHDNLELKYCLRSIEKYLTGYDDIYIVTKKLPKWITNVKHVEVCDAQKYGHIAYNIANKIKAAFDEIESDIALLMSDDYYLTEAINANEVPYYNKGDIGRNYVQRNRNESYTQTLLNTFNLLSLAHEKDCDLHYPVVFQKQKFLSILPDKWPPHGYSIRSLYSNLNKIETKFMCDNKIKKASEFKDDMKFFSTSDMQIDKDMKALFERLYPSPSKYEK